jgi:quinol monooxygenase YgiN
MYAAMGLVTAKPGQEEALYRAAMAHAAALRQQPGCVAAYALRESATGEVIGLSVFDSEAALQAATASTQGVLVEHRLPELVARPPEFRVFDAE